LSISDARSRIHDPEMAGQKIPVSSRGRLVYSTDKGKMCPDCGWPADDCHCSRGLATASVPDRIVARVRMEKSGRGGKTVTVVDGLPQNAAFLKALAQELKRVCGTGGRLVEGGVELQGDLRARVRQHLEQKGYRVKG
jgi:translation initiation factor 1